MIAVLFVREDSIYKKIDSCDCYDIKRNALNYPGGKPIIAHPPCRAWGKLSHFAKPLPGEKELATWSVKQIQKNSGVLEHPNGSQLWNEMELPKGQQIDEFGGWTLSVNQHWFGHKAEKKTLLYIVGCKPSEIPEYKIPLNAVTHIINTSKKNNRLKECTKAEREETPIEFAKWLVELAKKCKI